MRESVFELPELLLQHGVTEGMDPPDVCDRGVEVWAQPDGRVIARCGSREGYHWVDLPDLARFSFDGSGHQVTAVRCAPIPDETLADAYRRSALPLVLQALGIEVLHASGVVIPGGVVGLCGDSGAGKSTMAYGLGRRGYPLWADDALAVMVSDRAIRTSRLPFEVQLRPASASFFGTDTIKRECAWGADARRAGTTSEPLAALCLLEREPSGDDTPRITRLRPRAAFPALLAHAYCFSLKDPANKRRVVNHYLELAAKIPVFMVRFESRFEALPEVLDMIERTVGQLAPAP